MNYKFINNPEYKEVNEELKSTYNKWLQRQFGKRIPIHVFGSSSEGNSIYLEPYKMLVDIGLPFKVYNSYNSTFFLDVDYIFLTHHHGDHLNPSTLANVLDNYPHIKVIITDFMWKVITSDIYKPEYIRRETNEQVPFGHDIVFKTDENGDRIQKESKWKERFSKHSSKFITATEQTFKTHKGKEFLIEPLTVKHGDLINAALQISDPELDFEFLYVSDLDNLDGPRSFIDCFGETQYVTGLRQDKEYTCMFVEANYDEAILQAWYDNLHPDDPEYRGKKARADGNLRHISEQETSVYIKEHLSEKGLFIPLHASKTFGTLHQD